MYVTNSNLETSTQKHVSMPIYTRTPIIFNLNFSKSTQSVFCRRTCPENLCRKTCAKVPKFLCRRTCAEVPLSKNLCRYRMRTVANFDSYEYRAAPKKIDDEKKRQEKNAKAMATRAEKKNKVFF